MELTESAVRAQEEHAALLMKIEAERRARTLVVPTDPREVQLKLRSLGHPICLFGERPGDRRDRLRRIMATSDLAAEETAAVSRQAASATGRGTTVARDKPQKRETFYTPAAEKLKAARTVIAQLSFERASERLGRERALDSDAKVAHAADTEAVALWKTMRALRPSMSQVGDVRPLQGCGFRSDAGRIATASWTGDVRLWDPAECEHIATLKSHEERVVSLAWTPNRSASDSSETAALVSGSADSTCRIWPDFSPSAVAAGTVAVSDAASGAAASSSAQDATMGEEADPAEASSATASRKAAAVPVVRPLAALVGHADRISRVAWHPSGRFVGTTSYDKTFRLWDVERSQELLLQEGHAREAYALAFHPDGSLAATGDLGGVGRVWDLRSGKSIFLLHGHLKQLLALDFSPDGFTIASGSDDNTSKVWDLRQRKLIYTILGHSGLVSTVKFAPRSGEYLATASYDGTVRTWNARTWENLSTLRGHEGQVTGVDISQTDERTLLSCSLDKTFKLWAHEDLF